jgi:hypothetical protein
MDTLPYSLKGFVRRRNQMYDFYSMSRISVRFAALISLALPRVNVEIRPRASSCQFEGIGFG